MPLKQYHIKYKKNGKSKQVSYMTREARDIAYGMKKLKQRCCLFRFDKLVDS